MLNAKKAREKVDAVLRAEELKEFDQIMNQIERAVDTIKYRLVLEKVISKYIWGKLDELGFKVDELRNTSGDLVTCISW
jgi:hypothetical protein